MINEQSTISYDEFMPQPLSERLNIFNEISAENRALLVKTHVERWLAANQIRLTPEQVAIVKDVIRFIVPEQYQEGRDFEKVHREAEALRAKAEVVFTPEEMMQMMTNYAEYIPAA